MSDERVSFTHQPGSSPQITLQGSTHALVPGDYAAIYNINPVYQAGIDGAGTTLAVVGRTDFFFEDVLDFQTVFGLPFNFPTIIFNGPDPGNLGGLEEAEALLDTSWSGATAPNAAIRFVVSASTDATDGADLSELYIIDNDIGDVLTESFGGCEAAVTSTQAAGIEALAQQAAAQGITYMVSSGDTGAAGCDDLSESLAKGPVSVNALASTPFTVAVGGTIFNENGHNSTYWNSTNDPSTLASVKSYIPENVWNETCTTQCPSGAAPLAAGGGGASTLFSKPSWQSGVAGIPADSARYARRLTHSGASRSLPLVL
jgi:subtilase family serine protease